MKNMTYFLIIFFVFSSFNRKYLKLLKMDISGFKFKLFIYIHCIVGCTNHYLKSQKSFLL